MTKKIKRLMEQNGATFVQIARDMGVTKTWVSLVLNYPRRHKSARVWKEIAKRVHKPVWEICPSMPVDRLHDEAESGPRRRKAA